MIYFTAALATFLIALLIVRTQHWHGALSMDSTLGVQKFHTNPTPRIGGVAIACGLAVVYLLGSAELRQLLAPIALAGIPAFAAGLAEDLTKRVGVLPRLLATIFSGVLAWWLTGVAMRNTGLSAMDSLLSYTPFAVLFTAIAVGGVANAVNIIDGFNGLAIGAVTIMLGAMGLIALSVGDAQLASVCFLIAAIALGFAAINWPLGYLFLGDGGAYLLGFLLAWIAVLLPMRNPQVTAWSTMLVCSYPVLEVVYSFYRRSQRKGVSATQPDQEHLHHLFHRAIVRPSLPQASSTLQNGMTSPIAWVYALLPCSWAVLFARDSFMLFLGFILATFTYAVLYRQLSRMDWQPSAPAALLQKD